MRVSEYYELGRTQPALDFVDVDTATDSRVFIDPRAIRIQSSGFAENCKMLLVSFFHELLMAIFENDDSRVYNLLGQLTEPNETHLGYSKGRSRGRGLGGVGAERVAAMIRNSKAAKSGVLADLEDTALFIDGIKNDIVSDIATHILRGALIGYTQRAAEYYHIPLERQYSGAIWNPDICEWEFDYVDLPRVDEEPLLLIPKSIVRFELTLDQNKYYNGFLAPLHEAAEIDARSNLVSILKNGTPRVNREKLREKYPVNKPAIVEYTHQFPEALDRYKTSISHLSSPVLTHEQLAQRLDVPNPDYDGLLARMKRIPAGKAAAHIYHSAVEELMTALFYPHLGNVRKEREIHEGRKRIDICYDNLSNMGTFFWLTRHRAAEIPVECKNYRKDPRNPELDQMVGRFSDHRGRVGIMTCRKLYDKALFIQRCRDTARDGNGFVLPLDDADFEVLVEERKKVQNDSYRDKSMYKLIRERFDALVA
ncbi:MULTISPECIES: hypothetical protein [unclassified Micromonospora]|uniref:hypothetical protein n=1 Tax=unclassified Micromonospora TaxID=2617518 RepID=UPI001C24E5BA|nr:MULTISPECIES: hypothetical protein [unclassified Micromonospora]MBU8857226.1 hypothetical protein [Micromonospora sp. WMMB482]MDM4782847.1 hypothetical protein [Micromonospora sp. b486]